MIDFIQKVFHVAQDVENERFIEDGALLISKEDGYWCGTGMYFWDNISNARYWVNKKRNNKIVKYTISQALLKCSSDDILDLTDKESCDNLIKSAKSMLSKMELEDRIKLDFNQTGAVINFVYNFSKKYGLPTFKVVKMQGIYGNPKLVDSIYGETLKYPHPTIRTKTIYAVREIELLKDRQEVS